MNRHTMTTATEDCQPAGKRPGATMGFLALSDLRHEWMLNLCVVLALAAVLAPLLLLLGLKNGTIQTLRMRLVEDPVYRELKPQQTLNLRQDWFDAMAARQDVAFVLPTILRGSSVVRAASIESSESEPMDLLPTGPGDVLILENNGVVPGPDQVVLSADAAERLNIMPADTVRLQITRSRSGRFESVSVEFEVIAVLDRKADAQPRIYAPLGFVEDVEAYREGRAVLHRNWSGGSATPYLSFDGVLVIAPEGLDSIVARSLTIGTGFALMESLSPDVFTERTGLSPPPGSDIYDVHVLREPVQWSGVRNLKDKLRGRNVVTLPYVRESALLFETGLGTQLQLPAVGLSLSSQASAVLNLPDLPWGVLDPDRDFADYARILLPPERLSEAAQTVGVKLVNAPNTPRISLRVEGPAFGDRHAVVPVELLAMLRTGTTREIVYSTEQQRLLLARAGYSGFRLYARSIDDVVTLYRELREQGIESIARVQDIERLRILDRGLTRLFWLVATVGIVGGIAALIANLYAAVERKKRDISILRLMGLSRLLVARFPVYQSAIIAFLAAALAILVFHILAAVINTVFADDLGLGERICELPASSLALALLLTVVAAVASSLLAAWRTNRIEPAEAIRVE